MRLLVLSSQDPGNVAHGMGLIVHNTLKCLINLGHSIRLGVIMSNEDGDGQYSYDQGRTAAFEDIQVFRIQRQAGLRQDAFRALTRSFLNREQRLFLGKARRYSQSCDLVVWFGHCWDPLTSEISLACECPVLLHVNDSITLSRKQRTGGLKARVQCRLAEFRETSVLNCAKNGSVGIVYVAEADRQAALAAAHSGVRDSVFCLPLAVDTDVFTPSTEFNPRRTPVAIFTGAMSFRPNVLTAERLVRKVMPLLPDSLELRLVGKNPSAAVKELAKLDMRVCVTGEVADIAAQYRAADIFLAPMPPSPGMKNKLLEAMACGLPVVASPDACGGFDGIPPGVLVASTDAEFAQITRRLAEDRDLIVQTGFEGRRFVVQHHSWEDRTRRLLRLLSGS